MTALSSTPSDTTASLQWSYQDSGSSPRDGAVLEVWRGGALVTSMMVRSTVLSTTLSSLQPLTNYTFTVYAVSAVGRSAPTSVHASTLSLSQSLTPCTTSAS